MVVFCSQGLRCSYGSLWCIKYNGKWKHNRICFKICEMLKLSLSCWPNNNKMLSQRCVLTPGVIRDILVVVFYPANTTYSHNAALMLGQHLRLMFAEYIAIIIYYASLSAVAWYWLSWSMLARCSGGWGLVEIRALYDRWIQDHIHSCDNLSEKYPLQ